GQGAEVEQQGRTAEAEVDEQRRIRKRIIDEPRLHEPSHIVPPLVREARACGSAASCDTKAAAKGTLCCLFNCPAGAEDIASARLFCPTISCQARHKQSAIFAPSTRQPNRLRR